MRISELSSRSGVPVASIKFYLREGLLAAGERSSPNQAEYADDHVTRLRLIRAFLEVGGLSIAAARDVLAALDDDTVPFGETAAIASQAIPAGPARGGDADHGGATVVADLVRRRGWHVSAENPGLGLAARVVDDYRALGRDDLLATLDVYADAAERVAAADLAAVAATPDRADRTQTIVVGTVLGDALLAGLRRLAHENASSSVFPVSGHHEGVDS